MPKTQIKPKHIQEPLLVLGLIVLAITIAVMVSQTFGRKVPSVEPAVQTIEGAKFMLTSNAFLDGQAIPALYTCTGANINPPLNIENPPGNAKQFVLVMHDPDAKGQDVTHWLLWDIPVETTNIGEHTVPAGAAEGTTDFGKPGYSGPCPQNGSGVHTYTFDLYALNDSLLLGSNTTRDELLSAINGKVIAKAQLTGTVTAK